MHRWRAGRRPRPAAGSGRDRRARATRAAEASPAGRDRSRPTRAAAPGRSTVPVRPPSDPSTASAWRHFARATSYGASKAAQASATRRQAGGAILAFEPPLVRARRREGRLRRPDGTRSSSARRRRRSSSVATRITVRGPLPGCGERREQAVLAGLRGRCSVDTSHHRGHARGEDPFLGLADALPATVDRAARVGDVVAPQRERRRREVVQAGQLRLAKRVELHDRLAEEARCFGARVGLDLDDGELEDRGQVDDADRQPAHRPEADVSGLLPATEVVEGLDSVARQEVAVHGLEPRARLASSMPA